MKTFLALLLAFVCSACVGKWAKRPAEELDIREATYRYQFGKNASGQQQSAKNYYLSVDIGDKREDPDDAVIKRFADNTPPVKKVSECHASANTGVVDKKTGERGLIFYTGAIKRVS